MLQTVFSSLVATGTDNMKNCNECRDEILNIFFFYLCYLNASDVTMQRTAVIVLLTASREVAISDCN
jgi:hypothetical protein